MSTTTYEKNDFVIYKNDDLTFADTIANKQGQSYFLSDYKAANINNLNTSLISIIRGVQNSDTITNPEINTINQNNRRKLNCFLKSGPSNPSINTAKSAPLSMLELYNMFYLQINNTFYPIYVVKNTNNIKVSNVMEQKHFDIVLNQLNVGRDDKENSYKWNIDGFFTPDSITTNPYISTTTPDTITTTPYYSTTTTTPYSMTSGNILTTPYSMTSGNIFTNLDSTTTGNITTPYKYDITTTGNTQITDYILQVDILPNGNTYVTSQEPSIYQYYSTPSSNIPTTQGNTYYPTSQNDILTSQSNMIRSNYSVLLTEKPVSYRDYNYSQYLSNESTGLGEYDYSQQQLSQESTGLSEYDYSQNLSEEPTGVSDYDYSQQLSQEPTGLMDYGLSNMPTTNYDNNILFGSMLPTASEYGIESTPISSDTSNMYTQSLERVPNVQSMIQEKKLGNDIYSRFGSLPEKSETNYRPIPAVFGVKW
jgi:hypothetical protein